MVWEFFARLAVYGCVGVIMEILFTGFHSLIVLRDRSAISRTSLHMIPIYGLGAEGLGLLRMLLPQPYFFIPAAVLFIFAAEYASGWTLRKAGIKIWDYSHSKFSLHGLVRADYLPFWLMVAVAYDILADFVTKILTFVGSMA